MTPAKQKDSTASNPLPTLLSKFGVADPLEDPSAFVRSLVLLWKNRGGRFEGKPRHSDRYLGDLLKSSRTPVRSLTSKLSGATRLQADDAGALVRTVLSYWRYVGEPTEVPSGKAAQYEAALDAKQIDEVADLVQRKMAEADEGARTAHRADSGESAALPGEETGRLLRSKFSDNDAMFTVSSGQTLILPHDPKLVLKGFRDLITELWNIEVNDKRGRFLVWILDSTVWGWEEKDWGSRLRFMNVQALITRFKALKKFPDRQFSASKRWDWLESNAVIVVYGLEPNALRETNIQIESELSRLQAQYVLINTVPNEWATSPRFFALYGSELERKDEASYSILVSEGDQSLPQISSALDLPLDFRYFAHAHFSSQHDEKEAGQPGQPRTLELPDPGWSYEIANKYIYAAARHFLGSRDKSTQQADFGAAAMEGLRRKGFSFLSPEQFIAL